MADFILLNEDFSDFPIGEFPYDRIIRQWVSIILSIIPDIMVNGMTRYATTFITVRGFLDYF